MSLIGLDIGTSGCKAIAFDHSGSILTSATREYAITKPQPGWAEQDAEEVWHYALDSLKQVCSALAHDPPVAMAISAQGEAVMALDGDGQAISPVILGMDTRTAAENEWLSTRLGDEWLYAHTGVPVHTINTLPKLLWMRENWPGIWTRARRFALYEDYVVERLCGAPSISHCLASRTQMYNLQAGDWSDSVLSACRIDSRRLPPLAPGAGGIVGQLTPATARSLGVPSFPIVSGGHDQACAALGAGVISAGRGMVSTGTAEVVEVAMGAPSLNKALRDGGVSIYRHVVPGLYLAMTLNHSGGLLLRWYRDNFCTEELVQAHHTGADAYDLILANAPVGPTDLLVLPHWSGSGTPTLDTLSRGAVLGLTFSDSKSGLAKALLEGLCYELCLNLDLLREQAAIPIESLRAVGGGARSQMWLQLKADICNVPLHVPLVTEAACLGAALLAGVAAGEYASFEQAVETTVRVDQKIVPDRRLHAEYAMRYALYCELYPSLRSLSHRLAALSQGPTEA